MSDKLYNEVGVMPPLAQAAVLRGCTVFRVQNSSGSDFAQGAVVLLVPAGGNPTDYTDFDPETIETYTIVGVPAANTTDAAASQQSRPTAVLIDAIANGEFGWVVARGLVLALCDGDTGTAISKNLGLYCEAGDNLTPVIDASTGDHIKIIAIGRVDNSNATGPDVLMPVLFNGIEGFGFFTNVA